MPPTIDDFIDLLAAYGLELQVEYDPQEHERLYGVDPRKMPIPGGNLYTVRHSRYSGQRGEQLSGKPYGVNNHLIGLQRQVLQKLRQQIGDDNEWLAVMRSAYGNNNLGVDDIPIAQATQGELDDALSGKISRDEDEMFFGGVPTPKTDRDTQLGTMQDDTPLFADQMKAYKEWSQDPQRRLKGTPVGYEDYIASLQADAPITEPPITDPDADFFGGTGYGMYQSPEEELAAFPLGIKDSREEAEAQKASNPLFARGIVVEHPTRPGKFGIRFLFEEEEQKGFVDYEIVDIGGIKYIRTATGLTPLQTVARPKPDVASSVDQLIAAAFARGDTERAEELWNFKNQPTDYENYSLALQFAESDADMSVIKQWFDIFTGGGAAKPELDVEDYGWQSEEKVDPVTGQITHHVTKTPKPYPGFSQYLDPGVQFTDQFGKKGGPPSMPSIDGRPILSNVPRAEHYFGMDEWFAAQEGKFPTVKPEPYIPTPEQQFEDQPLSPMGELPGSPGYKILQGTQFKPTQVPPSPGPLGMDEWFITEEAKKFPSATSTKPKKTGYGEITPEAANAMMKALKGRPESQADAQAERWRKLEEYRKRNRRFRQAGVAARYQPIGKGMGVR